MDADHVLSGRVPGPTGRCCNSHRPRELQRDEYILRHDSDRIKIVIRISTILRPRVGYPFERCLNYPRADEESRTVHLVVFVPKHCRRLGRTAAGYAMLPCLRAD